MKMFSETYLILQDNPIKHEIYYLIQTWTTSFVDGRQQVPNIVSRTDK